jgi:transposase
VGGLDAGTMRVYVEADAPRVSCAEHGVVVAAVPWARHGSRFRTAFEDTAAWLACHAALTVLAVLLRITWRWVSAIVIRGVAEAAGKRDRLAGRVGSGLMRSPTGRGSGMWCAW